MDVDQAIKELEKYLEMAKRCREGNPPTYEFIQQIYTAEEAVAVIADEYRHSIPGTR